jgi:hypothetical protein
MLRNILSIGAASLLVASTSAQVSNPTDGPDIAVSRIANNTTEIAEFGTSSGIAAFSLASTSCNVGDEVVRWNDSIDDAPVIAQNIFRVDPDGRFTQLGYSWLKASFCAISEPTCGSCNATGCNTLGIGCADTYGSGLNDGRTGVAKFEVNPTTGVWPSNWSAVPSGNNTTRGRLQCDASLCADPASTYFAEIQYVSEHDHEYGLARNNSSWIEVQWASAGNANSSLSTTGGINMFDPGIFGWQDEYSDVVISEVRIVAEGGTGPLGDTIDGIFFVGSKATDIGGGAYRYDYVVQNFNSDRSVNSISIPTICSPTNLQYTDVEHHSGSPWGNADWTSTTTSSDINWESQQSFAQNQNANAIRWGTAYTFSFEANSAPSATMGSVDLGIFKPGTGSTLSADAIVPGANCCSGGSVVNTCTGIPNLLNSTGFPAVQNMIGSTNVIANDLELSCNSVPANEFGFPVMSQGTTNVPLAAGGTLCVGPTFYRLTSLLSNSGAGSSFNFSVDNTNLPQSQNFAPGDTWHFQTWFRDGSSAANLTNATSVTFCN